MSNQYLSVRVLIMCAATLVGFALAAPLASAQMPIIVDHNCTDLDQVPAYWIEQAKTVFKITYGHTSHGSQPISGMNEFCDPAGSLYWWDHDGTQGGLSLWDYTPGGDLGQSGDLTWYNSTRTLLDGAGADRTMVVWSWCGGVSGNTEADIDTYLNAMNTLEIDYPNVTFIYMTGHLDGTGVDGNLNIRNNQIRDFCVANGKILFDFADMESYDPDGNEFLSLDANDACDYWLDGTQYNWADQWCAANPGECTSCSCAHSRSLNCDRKGRAFWWMLARASMGTAAAADLNRDWCVDLADLATLLASYQVDAGGDQDNDGDTDLADLATFLANYGVGCE